MRIAQLLVVSIFVLGCVSGCSLDPNAKKLYKQETPLEAEVIVPELLEPTDDATIQVILTQNGERVDNPDYVHLEIWKQDGTVNYGMKEAHNDGDGQFSLSRNFEKEGLYYVQVHAGSNGSFIMPTKQFIVGELSESDLDALQSDAPNVSGSGGSHH